MAIVCSTARCPRGQCRRIGVWSGGGGALYGNSPGSSSSATSPASSPSPSSTGTMLTLELTSMMNMLYIIKILAGIVVPWNSSKSLKNSYCGAGNFKNLKKSLMSSNIVLKILSRIYRYSCVQAAECGGSHHLPARLLRAPHHQEVVGAGHQSEAT